MTPLDVTNVCGVMIHQGMIKQYQQRNLVLYMLMTFQKRNGWITGKGCRYKGDKEKSQNVQKHVIVELFLCIAPHTSTLVSLPAYCIIVSRKYTQ